VCFSAKVGRHFLKSSNVGRHLCPDFAHIFRDFAQIFKKSKLLEVRLLSLHPASSTTAAAEEEDIL